MALSTHTLHMKAHGRKDGVLINMENKFHKYQEDPMKKRIFLIMPCFLLAAALLLPASGLAQAKKARPAAPAKDEFPSNRELEARNMALIMEGFAFTSGMRANQSGQPNCLGLELAPAKWNGSGFLVKSDGTIVTNYHVASKALRGIGKLADGSSYEINNIKVYHPFEDIAILKLTGQRQFPAASLGDSDRVEARDKVMAVGNPLGMGINITEGQVSQVVKDEKSSALVIRHTAQIAPGNSGGALYKGGQVVGVNASVNLAMGQMTGFNNAIPINKVKALLSNPKYDRVVPLTQAFPTKIETILQISKDIKAVNGQVPAATGSNRPGTAVLNVQLNPLEDILIVLNSPGRDLALSILNAQGKLLGCGDVRLQGTEGILFSSQYPQQISIVVVNYDAAPANFGLNVRSILW